MTARAVVEGVADWRAHIEINGPGIYDMPMEAYHACTWALSSSGAREMLDSCPAKFRAKQALPQRQSDALDFGTLAHALMLEGEDAPSRYVVIGADAPSKPTRRQIDAKKPSQDTLDAVAFWRDIEESGRKPVAVETWEAAQAMVKAMRAHPFAGALFTNGTPERSLFWRDEEFGIWCRCRLDWLPASGRIIPDYKTCRSALPADLERAMWDWGYYQQAAWYSDGVKAVLRFDPAFVLACQEKDPPNLITVAQPGAFAIEWGRVRNRKAKEIFAAGMATGVWLGYADDVVTLNLPVWAEKQLEREHAAGAYAPATAA